MPNIQPKHLYALAFATGLVAGFFVMTGGNTYGVGQWGASTFGRAYSAGADLAAP